MSAAAGLPGFSLLTPPGRAGIQVVALGGSQRYVWLASALRRPDGSAVDPDWLVGREGVRVDLWLAPGPGVEPELVDEVLFVDRPGPVGGRSELHLHGAPTVLEALRRELGPCGPEPGAEPLPRFERLLREARCDAQLAVALEQLEFGEHAFGELRERVGSAPVDERRGLLEGLRTARRVLRVLLDPPRLALVGLQNAGKSTLFNRLLFADRNLVGARPGLTRDAIAEPVDLAGYPFELVDTAGIGPEVDAVDALAQARSRVELERAESLLVVASDQGFDDFASAIRDRALLVIESKADRERRGSWPEGVATVPVQAIDEGRALEVRRRIGKALLDVLDLPNAPVSGLGFVLPRSEADDRWIDRVASE